LWTSITSSGGNCLQNRYQSFLSRSSGGDSENKWPEWRRCKAWWLLIIEVKVECILKARAIRLFELKVLPMIYWTIKGSFHLTAR
jgi:hypothetical protein